MDFKKGWTLDKIIKAISLLSIVAVIVASLDLRRYYQQFQIDIFSYIGVSEILIKSAGRLGSIFIEIIFAFLICEAVTRYLEGKKNSPHNAIKRKRRYLIFVGIITVVATLAIIYPSHIYSWKSETGVDLENFVRRVCLLSVGMYNYWYGGVYGKIQDLKPTSSSFAVMLVFYGGWVVFSNYLNTSNYDRMESLKKFPSLPNQEYILTKSECFTLADSISYIGKTDNYFFFWNKQNNTSSIYPISRVEEVIVLNSVKY